jgi:hypothetical protein
LIAGALLLTAVDGRSSELNHREPHRRAGVGAIEQAFDLPSLKRGNLADQLLTLLEEQEDATVQQRSVAGCSDPQMPDNCIEVWPGQSGTGYTYHPSQTVYFFPDLSGIDRYYLLMGDLSCEMSCAIFGFPDPDPAVPGRTVFDLNGYTISYSSAGYTELINNGFEQWDADQPTGWTVQSGSVQSRSTQQWQPMSGTQVLYTAGPMAIVSTPLPLPRARAYQGYVTVGKAEAEETVSIEILNAEQEVVCSGSSRSAVGHVRGETITCRFDALAGGTYSLRIMTTGQAYLDRTGIVPLGDYGIATLTSSNLAASALPTNLSGLTVPLTADGPSGSTENKLEVWNGRIEAAHEDQVSYGIHAGGKLEASLHDLSIVGKGIQSHTIDAAGDIHDNTLLVDMPWYFRREQTQEENLILRGGNFYRNVAIGGQGVIRLKGDGTEVFDNYISNNAQATNHYAIIHSGAVSPRIHGNLFDPIEGSGILTYIGQGYQIFNNLFHVRSAPCNVEYINEDYSTNGVRINDYGSGQSTNTLVFDNAFLVNGTYSESAWPNCMPITNGIFYSASGPDNRVHDNYFRVIKETADQIAPVYGLYVGDALNTPPDNPLFYNNTFETNDKAVWLANPYGDAENLWFETNTYVRLENPFYSPANPYAAIRIGHSDNSAGGLRMINDYFSGFDADGVVYTASNTAAQFDLTKQWYLTVTVKDAAGQPVSAATVTVNSLTQPAYSEAAVTGGDGIAVLKVTEYVERGDLTPGGTRSRDVYSPFTLVVDDQGDLTNVEGVMVEHATNMSVQLGTGVVIECADCLNEVIVDNQDPQTQQAGAWVASSYYSGFYGTDYLYSTPENQAGLWFQWNASLEPGRYDIHARWPDTGSGRPDDVSYEIEHLAGTTVLTGIDQRVNGATWNLLGTFDFGSTGGVRVVSGSTGVDGTAADAIMFKEVCVEAVPEISGLNWLADAETLVWDSPGSGGSDLRFDTLRSQTAEDFVRLAVCLESDDGQDTFALDSERPSSRSVNYYLVRAEGVCGLGSLGFSSTGSMRSGLVCSLPPEW